MLGTEEEAWLAGGLTGGPIIVRQALSEALETAGWFRVGCGTEREAFLAPSGVVYKVERRWGGGYGGSNDEEHQTAQRLRNSTHPDVVEGLKLVYIPDTHFWPNRVLAMEYIDGTSRTLWECDQNGVQRGDVMEAIYNLGVGDYHPGNVVWTTDGRCAIIDLGVMNKEVG